MSDYLLIQGDARRLPLADESVHCAVTSPPYWGLRDYGCAGQLGLEETLEEYVANMVAAFRDVRRVLRKDATCWVNLGDSYATGTNTPSKPSSHVDVGYWQSADNIGRSRIDGSASGLKPKDLVGIPWAVAFALRADGWWLRSDCIWAKSSTMPESVTDRPTKAHEYLFLLAKSERYYYDHIAIRESDKGQDHARNVLHKPEPSGGILSPHMGLRTPQGRDGMGANCRTVWTIPPEPYRGSHFATFPRALVRRPILAGTSAKGCCPRCGTPWERVTEQTRTNTRPGHSNKFENATDHEHRTKAGLLYRPETITTTLGWRPCCSCDAGDPVPCTVLDPFSGAGTTGVVALAHGRRYVGVELNPKYLAMSQRRIERPHAPVPRHHEPMPLFDREEER